MDRTWHIFALAIPILGLCGLLAVIATGCSELADPLQRQGGPSQNCLACHLNQAILQANAEPDTSQGEEPEGEG